MTWFPCPYLGTEVELTDERREHIAVEHPDVLARELANEETLRHPDIIRRRTVGTEYQFTRWFDLPGQARHIVIIVVGGEAAGGQSARHWIVTAYTARRLAPEGTKWKAV